MDIYQELGIRRIINAQATLTRLGGSVLAPGVAEAMSAAGEAFVDMFALQEAVGIEIARLTGNEACYVSSGAAAGLTLLMAACMAGADPLLRERLPITSGLRDEIIVHAHTRVVYDFALRMSGARLIEIGSPEGTTPKMLEAALTARTAAVVYFARTCEDRGELPLEEAVQLCRPHGVPVIVDAAAQLPPRSNLWDFTRRGADAAVFSGGKGLRGPQTTGLILGRKELIDACAYHACPNPFIGRGMKVGKEELCGVLAAVRWYMEHDEDAENAFYESVVDQVIQLFAGNPGVTPRRVWPSEAGQPLARAGLALDEARLGKTRDQVLARLLAGDPAIALDSGAGAELIVNPQTLQESEVPILLRRLSEELGA